MNIPEFYSDGTFVAFMDISGFKEKMKNKEDWEALDRFYHEGYRLLFAQRENNPRVDGIFISDCGILFVRNESHAMDLESLRILLNLIKKINENLLAKKIYLSTSIAFGKFECKEKLEFEGLSKNPIAGYAYLHAYEDTETRPKAEAGQCRLIAEGLPGNVKEAIENSITLGDNADPFAMMRRKKSKYYYFYWMARTSDDIKKIDTAYKRANESKYIAIGQILQQNYDWIEYLDRISNI